MLVPIHLHEACTNETHPALVDVANAVLYHNEAAKSPHEIPCKNEHGFYGQAALSQGPGGSLVQHCDLLGSYIEGPLSEFIGPALESEDGAEEEMQAFRITRESRDAILQAEQSLKA